MTPWVVLLALASPSSSSSSLRLSVLLQFDGSLRFPSDPGFPTSSLSRMAACAACIIILQDDDDDDETTKIRRRVVVRMGGRTLQGTVSSMTTSAEVEYEGLLFGLEGLKCYLDERNFEEGDPVVHRSSSIDVVVQGDCKNVLEQMRGSARPRKLEAYHRTATEFIKENFFSNCRFRFRHIPRCENELCDRISASILTEEQDTYFRTVCQELDSLRKESIADNATPHDGAKQNLQQLLSQYFGDGTSYIPLSKRPPLYRCMAEIAVQMDDYASLLDIGEQFQHELKTAWFSSSAVLTRRTSRRRGISKKANGPRGTEEESLPHDLSPSQPLHDLLLVEAIVYQMIALQALGRHKDARLLQRRKRFPLETYSTQAYRIQERLFTARTKNGWRPAASSPIILDDSKEMKKWPVLARQWYQEALRSKRWNETRVFWTQSQS